MPVIRALRQAGYRVIVMAPVDEFVSALSEEQVELYPLRQLRRNSTGLFRNVLLWIELYRLFRREKPDLTLHFTIKPNIFGNLAAAALRIPSICVVTGLGYTFLHRGWVQRITEKLYRFSFSFARKIVFENGEDRRVMVQRGIVDEAKSAVVNGCGVDIRHFSPNGFHPASGKIVFTFIGRLLYDKGIREFVEAAARVKQRFPQAEFWILGSLDNDNPAHIGRELLIEWVKNGAVIYKGATRDVRPFMSQSDWIVLPSYREGLSKVLIEAMSMGKPLITSDTPGCRETVEHGRNGFLTPVGDVESLAQRMGDCCAISPEKSRQMGLEGRKKAEQEFESSLIGEKYVEFVSEHLNILNK
jgi:glycosyltransferase involved in cell wall biosynthesis